jgi:hypothetical protein
MKLPAFAQLQPQRPEFLKRLDRQLELTPEQHERIARIMKASQERTAPLWENIAPQMQDELKRVRKEISQELTAEQRKKWAEMNKRGRAAAPGNQSDNPAPTPTVETNAP